MTRLTRRGFTTGAIAVVTGACGGEVATWGGDDDGLGSPGPSRPPSDPGFVPSPPPAAQPPDPNLAFSPVGAMAAPPGVIWSWTTEEQITELRRDKVLFTRESSPTLGRGFLFELLDERAAKGDEAASRLVGTELAKGRFGWSNPWATVRGAAEGESYGHELLAITMKPDTWYARVRTSRSEITFVDAAGKPVDRSAALASFERVGGILFENDLDTQRGCSTGSYGGGLVYREIYVGNEQRLATVAHRTAAIAAVLEGHIAELSALRDWFESGGVFSSLGGNWACESVLKWQGTPTTTIERYLASLAFATRLYVPGAPTLEAIIAELVAARFTPDPFTLP